MIKNYIKTAWRNLLKNKYYSLINIAGLTVGLAIGILILLWVNDELGFDAFHKQTANIYRLELWGGTGSSRQIWQHTPASIGAMAKQQLPEVKDQVRITFNNEFSQYKYQGKVFGNENVVFADPSFFSIFDFPLIEGNNAQPFINDNSVIITQKTALKYFGTQNPMGKVIRADDKDNFTVCGVINDFPKNSAMQFDMVMPISYHIKSTFIHEKIDLKNDFTNYNYDTYLLLKPSISLKSLASKIFKIHISHKADDTDAEYLLLPLAKMHLFNADGTEKGMETVRVFIIIAILILLIACINYVNLSTARSMLRSKEISMRKIVGAAKFHLFLQFIVETCLIFFIASLFSVAFIFLLMPVFNAISGKNLVFNLGDYHIWFVFLLTICSTLIASSIYPALLLSSFEPLKALKGKITAGIGDVAFRKILVVTQFSFSIILIVGTIIITSQLNYIRSKDLGYDKSHTFSLWMREMTSHYDAVKAELLKQPGIIGVTRSSNNLVRNGNLSGDNDWDGKSANQSFMVHPMAVDQDFISFFKLKLLAGSGFTGAVADSAHLILNEAAVREIGMKNPIGKRFRQWKVNGKIIGVVKDFHFASMKQKIAPAVFYYNKRDLRTLYVKTTGTDAPKAIAAAESQFKQYNGQYPFGYAFLDDIFNNIYKGEQQEGTLFTYFASIAIFISCLGLLGLAAFTAQVRTREIGVRKVLGASVTNITAMLSKDFLVLVIISLLIASPIAWFAMNNWLQSYAYRISIEWWVFPIAGTLAILIAFITISFQAIKAALANPVKSLRSE